MVTTDKVNPCQFYQTLGKYDKTRNMCLPQNRPSTLPESSHGMSYCCQSEQHLVNSDNTTRCLLQSVLSRPTLKRLLDADHYRHYSDQHILVHALVYMTRTKSKFLEDLDVLAFLGLAVDMLEDYSAEIFVMMVERYYVNQLLLCSERPDIFTSQPELSTVQILKIVNRRKGEILKLLDYNAHVDVSTEEYRQCDGMVDEMFRRVQNNRARRPLQRYKAEGIVRHSELIERDWYMGRRQASELVSSCLAKRKCRQEQMYDPYHFTGQQDTTTVRGSSNYISLVQPAQRKEVY